ncbi:MAG: type II toxin-antitoxin system RelE/ParE family toxin [Prolixibacteraceae bacterium]|nr:type II toxin-antitoxin system RelE/ParE family toxin [Prolixibacteraceae bacterium]
MALKISWSEKAGKSFENIIEYLELEFGYQVANSIARDIYHTLEILSVFPDADDNFKNK